MCSFHRFAIVAVLALITTQLKADVLSTIQAQCNTLGATQYEIAFVTSGGTHASSSDIANYNSFVSTQALSGSGYLSDFVPNGTTWNAIISTATVAASGNANNQVIPVFDTQGDLVTSNNLYSAALQHTIAYDQLGMTHIQSYAWTGSMLDGSPQPGYTAGSADVYLGRIDSIPDWNTGASTSSQGGLYPLYALSSPINDVPEPATLSLLGTALLGLGVAYLRRRGARA